MKVHFQPVLRAYVYCYWRCEGSEVFEVEILEDLESSGAVVLHNELKPTMVDDGRKRLD